MLCGRHSTSSFFSMAPVTANSSLTSMCHFHNVFIIHQAWLRYNSCWRKKRKSSAILFNMSVTWLDISVITKQLRKGDDNMKNDSLWHRIINGWKRSLLEKWKTIVSSSVYSSEGKTIVYMLVTTEEERVAYLLSWSVALIVKRTIMLKRKKENT